MAIRLREKPDSRELHYGASDGGETWKFTAICTAGEDRLEVWFYTLQHTAPTLPDSGFLRQDIKVAKTSGPMFDVEVTYGSKGVNGSDKPLGGENNDGNSSGSDTTAPQSETEPLKAGWTFSIRAPKIHITQSLATISKTKNDGGVAEDFKGAIGVGRDGAIAGVDWPTDSSFEFSRTVTRASVTLLYMRQLIQIAGRSNNELFYGWAAGEVYYMGAEGQYTNGEGWSITHKFGVERNAVNIPIQGFVNPVPAKKGWEYLWISYNEQTAPGVFVPHAAYVEQIVNPAAFGLLEIGE